MSIIHGFAKYDKSFFSDGMVGVCGRRRQNIAKDFARFGERNSALRFV